MRTVWGRLFSSWTDSTRRKCGPGTMWKEHTAQAPRAVTSTAHDLWSPDSTGGVTRCRCCRRGMEGRRCRTHSTSVWRLTSQTDRTASCVKRRVLAGRPTSTTADSATEKGDAPAAASAPPPRLGVVPTALHTMPLHTSSTRNKRCPAGTEHYKTKPLPYSPTWKSSRRCTDRRQGTEPTAHPIHRELKRLNGQYRQPPSTGSPVWTRDQSPSSASDLKTAATATPGRPLHRHLETAPVPPPLPAPIRSNDVQPQPHPCPGALLPDRKDLSGECAQPPDRFTRDDEAPTTPSVEPLDTQDTDDAFAGEGVYPQDAAGDHVMVSADSATPSTARDASGDDRAPWSSNSPLCPTAHRQAGKQRGVTVWPPYRRSHGPADVLCRSCWCLGQRPDLCQAIDRPLGSSRSHREPTLLSPPPPPPTPPRKSRRMIILLNCKPHARLEARPNKLASRTAFFRVDSNLSEKRAGRTKNWFNDS